MPKARDKLMLGQLASHSPLRSAYENAKRQLEKLKPSRGGADLAS